MSDSSKESLDFSSVIYPLKEALSEEPKSKPLPRRRRKFLFPKLKFRTRQPKPDRDVETQVCLRKIKECYPEHSKKPCYDRYDKLCIIAAIFILFIISWIIIQFWNRALFSLYFRTLCFDENSTYDLFVAAISVTLILLTILYFTNTLGERAVNNFVGKEAKRLCRNYNIYSIGKNY